jgi:internalin A
VPGPGDATLAPIGRFLNLERLSLSFSQLGDNGCTFLRTLTNLKQLVIVGTTALSQESMANLANLENLESLHLVATSVPDAGLTHLRNLRRLKVLDLSSSQISDDGLQHLKDLRQLESLSLQGTSVTGRGFVALKQMSALKKQDLARSRMSDEGLASLPRLTALVGLDLEKTCVTDAGLTHLAKLPALIELNLTETAVSDAGLVWLGKLTRLRSLDLCGTKVRGLELTRLAGLTDLRHLDLSATPLTVSGLRRLPAAPKLASLSPGGTHITDAGFADFRRFQGLMRLWLAGTEVSDAALAEIDKLPRLEYLDLSGIRVTDAAVEILNSMPSLVAVTLSKSSFSHAALAGLEPDECSWRRFGIVLAALDETTDAEFAGTPLSDVIEFFRTKHDVQILLDQRALAGKGVSAAMPITHRASGATLAASLDQILGPLGLKHVFHHEVLLITADKSRPHVEGFSPADWKPIPKKLADALDDVTQCGLDDQPLVDIVEYFRALHDVEIQIDHRALAQANVSPETPISIDVRGIQLASALALILEPLGLTYAPRYEVLLITSNPLPLHIEVPEPANQELSPTLAAALEAQTELDVTDQPLDDFIEHIRRAHPLDLRINKEAFAAAGRPTDVEVTIFVRNVSLRSVLALVSNELDLSCKLEGESLVIEPREQR